MIWPSNVVFQEFTAMINHTPEANNWISPIPAMPITRSDHEGVPHIGLIEGSAGRFGVLDIAYAPLQPETEATRFIDSTVHIPLEDGGDEGKAYSNRFVAIESTGLPPLDKRGIATAEEFWRENEIAARFFPESEARGLGFLALIELQDSTFMHELRDDETGSNRFSVSSHGIVLATARVLVARELHYETIRQRRTGDG